MRQLYRIATLLLCCLAHGTTQAQQTRTLSPNAIVSLMTVAPGAELYSTFGHSALRVYDPSQNVDRIYNYGTFDFDQPNFYVNFCRGKLLYILDVERYRSFERGNLLDRRGIQEQVLNLSPQQKERLFILLEDNALLENRSYKYDFFYDNCATRIRDMVQRALYDQVQFDSTQRFEGRTMRQLLQPYLVEHPWTGFGIDLVLGMPTDQPANASSAMFLPDHLSVAFQNAEVIGNGHLIERTFYIPEDYRPANRPMEVPKFPLFFTGILALLGLACMTTPKANQIFSTLFWLTLGIGGAIIAFLWFFTDHQATKNNLNLFWMLPTHLLVFWRKRPGGWLDSYFLITGFMALVLLIGMKWLPQEFPLAAIPLMVLVAVKGFLR